MTQSYEVIEEIFSIAGEGETTVPIAAPLAQLWRAGEWEAEQIAVALAEAIKE